MAKLNVFSNLAISLDGRIADAKHPSRSLGTPKDKALMKKIRQQADVVIMGAETLRVLGKAIDIKNKKGRKLVNVVISKSGELSPDLEFWKKSDVLRFVFTTEEGFSKAVLSAQDRAFVVAAGKDSVVASEVLRVLSKAGFRNILVEGGGRIMGLFLKERLLNELYVTLTPRILGGTRNPTLVDLDDTLSPWGSMRLLSSKKIKNELFLHYRFLNSSKS